jgi:prepilin-type N-terminal cleavage/methylation domain-containing protein
MKNWGHTGFFAQRKKLRVTFLDSAQREGHTGFLASQEDLCVPSVEGGHTGFSRGHTVFSAQRKKLCVPLPQKGLTLVELLVALMITGLMIAALNGIVGEVEGIRSFTRERSALAEDAHFAVERMVRAVQNTRNLMLPFPDNPNTNWREHVREQTIPPSPPEGDSTFATAVLAVTQDDAVDLDGDGIEDTDDDGDGQVDEDLYGDLTFDSAPGIVGIDDDGDGSIDEGGSTWWNDDEEGGGDEDPVNGVDDDGDGKVDEDPFRDMNSDGQPGLAGVDDDEDGNIDEGDPDDDDEDGQEDEDTLNPLVYYLQGNELIERTPVPWDENGGGVVSGLDFLESTIAENVTLFRVERVPDAGTRAQLVDLTLELTSPAGETISVNTRVRVGSAL